MSTMTEAPPLETQNTAPCASCGRISLRDHMTADGTGEGARFYCGAVPPAGDEGEALEAWRLEIARCTARVREVAGEARARAAETAQDAPEPDGDREDATEAAAPAEDAHDAPGEQNT